MGKSVDFSAAHCIWIYVCFATWLLSSHTNAQCTWPSVFDGTWLDSQQGQIVFDSTTQLTGFSVKSYGSTLGTYTCFEESFDTNQIIVLRSLSTYEAFDVDWYLYICLKFTELTNGVSYTYYRQHSRTADAGEHRVRPELVVTTLTAAEICDASGSASGSEFVTIIKQGLEASAYITCPSALLGRFEFNYTTSGGTEMCNDPTDTEHMNVCTNKTNIAFDDPCTGQSIVYASDSVYCVASVTVGSDTFVQLYNPDGSVDGSTTYRFSCMAISSDSLSATIVYNNCTSDQTSTSVPWDFEGNVIGASISFKPYVFCQGGCTWPAAFESSTWRDNTRGDVTFGTDTLTGWGIEVQGSTIDNWECLDNSFFDTEGILIMKSTQTFVFVGGTWTTYICFEMTQVANDSYYYYQKHDQIFAGGNERGYFDTDGTITDKTTICSGGTVPTAEFHFMVKSGTEAASKQYCSPSLLAKMDYTHTDSAGTVTCDTTTDDWDVCTDRTMMTSNYTTCNTVMTYSAFGTVYCMVNLTSTYEYTVVYNPGGSPNKFACIVSNSAGDAASVVYDNCTISQTPTSYAKQHDGTDIGYLVTMSATETCPFLGPTTAASTSASAEGGGSIIPIIAGVIVGLLLLIIIAIIVYCLKFKKRSDVSHNDNEKQKLPDDTRNGHIERIHVEDVDANPALTVQPPRNTLTPLPPKPDTNATTTPRVLPPITNHI